MTCKVSEDKQGQQFSILSIHVLLLYYQDIFHENQRRLRAAEPQPWEAEISQNDLLRSWSVEDHTWLARPFTCLIFLHYHSKLPLKTSHFPFYQQQQNRVCKTQRMIGQLQQQDYTISSHLLLPKEAQYLGREGRRE